MRASEDRLEGISPLRSDGVSEMREPVRTTQQVLGHSSPHTTLAFYTQSVEESERNAISKLERILFPNDPKFEEGLTLTP
jgi:integrase